MTEPAAVVFLLDVDNTLLDNDRVNDDLKRYLTQTFGAEEAERYWAIFEQRRKELGYADYLGTLQRYRLQNPGDPNCLHVSFYLLKYSFANRLYPRALDVIERLGLGGPRSSSRTATSYFSRARCTAQDYMKRSMAGC